MNHIYKGAKVSDLHPRVFGRGSAEKILLFGISLCVSSDWVACAVVYHEFSYNYLLQLSLPSSFCLGCLALLP